MAELEELMTSDRINALLKALELTPDNHPLRLMLAEALRDAGQHQAAIQQYDILLRAEQLPREALLPVGELALQADDLDLAARCLDAARRAGIVEGIATLRGRLDEQLDKRGAAKQRVSSVEGTAPTAPQDYLESAQPITFTGIGGLEEVKKVIHRMIILPLQRPDIYKRYKRQAGGGVLLYGPPGCGKTMLARATAAECDLPFINVRIENILDPYIGASERNLHGAFTLARQHAPCVMFLDEIDALAYARRKHQGSAGRALVDQLLQELDSIGSENQELLILAATNAPWDVDDALMRPGRFDRRIFVPPPDEETRYHILKLLIDDLPTTAIDLRRLAKSTQLFSGADLRALVDEATDQVIEEALDTQSHPPLTMKHFEIARAELRPTTLDWLARARNYVEFANQDDRYKEVATFLRSREIRDWKQ
jgi:transitional endoplasmic reticulum ATPase